MATDPIYNFLASMPAFANLPGTVLTLISQNLSRRRFKKGNLIYSEGDRIRSIFLLEMGLVEVYKLSQNGEKITLMMQAI